MFLLLHSARAQPACLPTQDDLISDDTNCYITGFGSIVANSQQREYFNIKLNVVS